ncbi:MAG: DUF6054 family protein [Chitinophagaceae bacterium]
MRHKTYSLQGHGLEEPVTRFVYNFWQQAHESVYEGGFIRVFEEYSWLNSNRMVVCLRLDTGRAAQGEVELEIIAGGAGGGFFFSFNWGTERRRIRHFEKELLVFCKANHINVEVVREG